MHLIHRINSPLAGLCLLLTSLFIYTSCSKGEKTALPQGDYVIVATFEPSSGQGTKTSLENTTETTKGVFWSDDDVIKVSNLEGATPSTSEYTLSSGAGTSSGVFSGDVAPGTKTGGFYPSTAVVRFSKSDDYACVISAVIPSVQKYSVGSFANNANLAAAYAENGNALTFKNVSGLLKLQLKGSAKIASITVSSSSDNLAGNVEIGLDKTYYTPSIISITEPVKSITLDCDDAGGVQLNTGTSTPFYIMVPPGAFSAGFTVTITDTDGNSMTKATTRDNTIVRSEIKSMPEFVFYPDIFSRSKTANCYICPPSGTYTFYAGIKGNSTAAGDAIDPDNVSVLWEEGSDRENIISSCSLNGDNTVTITTTGNEGNAVIAAYNSSRESEILWSWHIWCTDAPQAQGPYNNASGPYLMDRNLGAIGTSDKDSWGVFYQWGRKDPFPDGRTTPIFDDSKRNRRDESIGDIIAYTITHPYQFLYNDSSPYDWYSTDSGTKNDYLWSTANGLEGGSSGKSIYDPCPYGWKVAEAGTFANFYTGINPNVSGGFSEGYNFYYQGTSGGTSWYPASDFISYQNGSIPGSRGNLGYVWISSGDYAGEVHNGLCLTYGTGPATATTMYRAYGFPVRCLKE